MKSTPLYSAGLGAVAASMILFAFSSCSTTTPTSSSLLSASKSAGIDVRADEVFTISSGTESVVAAPTTAWAQIPATELRNGVTFAFAQFTTSEPKVAPGYYTLRAFANDIRVGSVKGRVQLVDRGGRVAAEIPAQIEIHSLRVPPGSNSSFVTTAPGARRTIWFRCSNGECIRFPVLRARELAVNPPRP